MSAASPQLSRDEARSLCAPSSNLNSGFLQFDTAHEAYAHLRSISKHENKEFTVRNFVCVIHKMLPEQALVETELFPRGALEMYTAKNMGWEVTPEQESAWMLPERGGDQGDYRAGIRAKINNAIECLKSEPLSKRAVIPIPFNSHGSETVDWKIQGEAKCFREIHLYLEDGLLKATGIMRMQNSNIFVKNIHWVAALLHEVATALGVGVGEYTHWITNLCFDRTATSC